MAVHTYILKYDARVFVKQKFRTVLSSKVYNSYYRLANYVVIVSCIQEQEKYYKKKF